MTENIPLFDITLHYLAPVGVVMLLGLLGGKGAKYLRMPKVTGYLLAGVLIGPSVLGLLSHTVVKDLSLITDIALGLIMFALGGVFEIHHIRSVGKKIVWLTIGQSVGAVVLTTGGLLLVGMHWFPAILLGTIGIATAPAATLLVVREFEAKGDFTDTLITVVATSNIVCILGFELVYSLGQIKEGASLLYAALSPIYELGGGLLIGGAVGYIISKWEQHIDDQAEMLMIIIAGIMLVTGLAITLNLQPLFANLVMGAVTTNLSLMHRLVYIELRQVEQPLYIAFFVLGRSCPAPGVPARPRSGWPDLSGQQNRREDFRHLLGGAASRPRRLDQKVPGLGNAGSGRSGYRTGGYDQALGSGDRRSYRSDHPLDYCHL